MKRAWIGGERRGIRAMKKVRTRGSRKVGRRKISSLDSGDKKDDSDAIEPPWDIGTPYTTSQAIYDTLLVVTAWCSCRFEANLSVIKWTKLPHSRQT